MNPLKINDIWKPTPSELPMPPVNWLKYTCSTLHIRRTNPPPAYCLENRLQWQCRNLLMARTRTLSDSGFSDLVVESQKKY